MRLPAYPLITVDPFFSIWSRSDKLYDAPTTLWCGNLKRLTGFVTIDGKAFRFLGAGKTPVLEQTNCTVTPFVTEYTFQNAAVSLSVRFWTPLTLEDLHILSTPCSFVDYRLEVLDKTPHDIEVSLCVHEEFCYDRRAKCVEKTLLSSGEHTVARMGRTQQKPLSKSGDGVSADWGYLYLEGGTLSVGNSKGAALQTTFSFQHLTKPVSFGNILAFDDIESILYFDKPLKALWHERFESIEAAIAYCRENHDALLLKMHQQEKTLLADATAFGEAYQKILTAAIRQVLAAHKLVRSAQGELLYLSKECHSNGCINTVDVSYPAVPLFLVYKPELVKAMLTGIFRFSRCPVWQADFAPHDIGTYPIANGQVYALKTGLMQRVSKRKVYTCRDFSVFRPQNQMPVEECGNMLIMSYAYYFLTGDSTQISENFDLLETWAGFLKKAGVVLENQLCTDDFAGHSEKNVNLAIKAVMGIACFAKICEALGKPQEDMQIPKDFAQKLTALATENGYFRFSLDEAGSWSLKYNLVWDILFDFHLFDKSLYRAESEKYKTQLNRYGVPLDSRAAFTKSDWMLWAACLDETGENIKRFSECIVRFLSETNDRNCFTDWFETKEPKERGMDHRSVQAGLWMPVLKSKLLEKGREACKN